MDAKFQDILLVSVGANAWIDSKLDSRSCCNRDTWGDQLQQCLAGSSVSIY